MTCVQTFDLVVAGFDSLNGDFERLFQNAPANGPEQEAEEMPPQVLALAYDNHVDIGGAVSLAVEGVNVARRATPHIGVRGREHNAVRI